MEAIAALRPIVARLALATAALLVLPGAAGATAGHSSFHGSDWTVHCGSVDREHDASCASEHVDCTLETDDDDCDEDEGEAEESSGSKCDDHNACTVDSCVDDVGCVHAPIPGCTPCATASDCNDHDACTSDTCTAGVCNHANAVTCTASDQCHVAGTCDPATGTCSNPAKDNGTACDDGDACTQTDTCQQGTCTGTNLVVCTASDQCHVAGTCNAGTGTCSNPTKANDTPCNDGNACTETDVCRAGACAGTAIDGCVPCVTAGDCADGNGCTTDTCHDGVCAHQTIADCVPCATAAECGDANVCTTDVCDASGVCEHQAVAGCTPCATDADCHDGDPCTTDACGPDKSCAVTAIPGCVRCESTAECDDHNACTTDGCTGGVCAHAQIPGCSTCVPTTELCANGKDDDCDGLVDCDDPNCAAAPNCQQNVVREICGDCIDNDGNGLVDYEDPACCAETTTLALRRVLLRSTAHGRHATRLLLKSLFSPVLPPGFDPMTQDTTLQIADGRGEVFCGTIGAMHWMRGRHRGEVAFWDEKGVFAHGLADGTFAKKKNGKVFFRTHGWRVPVRTLEGTKLRLTVRVGNRCVQVTEALRTKKSALVFP